MPADTTPGVAVAVDAAFREEWGRIVARQRTPTVRH